MGFINIDLFKIIKIVGPFLMIVPGIGIWVLPKTKDWRDIGVLMLILGTAWLIMSGNNFIHP